MPLVVDAEGIGSRNDAPQAFAPVDKLEFDLEVPLGPVLRLGQQLGQAHGEGGAGEGAHDLGTSREGDLVEGGARRSPPPDRCDQATVRNHSATSCLLSHQMSRILPREP